MAGEAQRPNAKVRKLATTLLYDLTQLPGESSEDEKRLGRAIVRFLDKRHLAVDALLDLAGPVSSGEKEGV